MRLALPTTPRQKIIISSSLTLVATAFLIIFITLPSIREIKNLNEQIETQRTELEKLYKKGQLFKQTLKEYEEIKPTVATLDRIYIKRGEELAFITSLEGVANVNGLQQDIKLLNQDPKKTTMTNTFPIQLELKGELGPLLRYLTSLEALDYYLNIDTIRISTASRDSGTGAALDTSRSRLVSLLLAAAYYKP